MKITILLWFDTEDYITPSDDDATLRLARFLTQEKVRATFKLVGEKARVLERRGRRDVIAALKKHEIGFHTDFHSVQPTPAAYLSNLNWDDGVAEFERREGPGFRDVARILGATPTCYGQPGGSWGPQVYGALRNLGINVYLDAGSHVDLDGRPLYYCGVLNLFRLAYSLRTGLGGPRDLARAKREFLEAHRALRRGDGGIMHIYYHPCEFVHRQFWDGVNFRAGANPPREQWKLPPVKTRDESRTAHETFEGYIRFVKSLPGVEFVTASQAAVLYRDAARGRRFPRSEMKKIAGGTGREISFQERGGYALAASEVFFLLNEAMAARNPAPVKLEFTPLGPTSPSPVMELPVTTDRSQFLRTVADVADYLRRRRRIPSCVWLGSRPVPPESYLRALAAVASRVLGGLGGGAMPGSITVKPARLAAADYVADDDPRLWGWTVFPRGFRAPAMMDLAKRQAWTIKPALRGQLLEGNQKL